MKNAIFVDGSRQLFCIAWVWDLSGAYPMYSYTNLIYGVN